ncbi:MAG: hypothetical protein ACP5HK_05495 [Acidilobus sp.]
MKRGASPEGPSAEREIARVVEKLLTRYSLYFDKYEALNSDGRRLLATALRYARRATPQTRARLREALRDPSLKTVLKLAESLGISGSSVQNGWPYKLGLL